MLELKNYKDLKAQLKDEGLCRKYIENMRWVMTHFALTATGQNHTN